MQLPMHRFANISSALLPLAIAFTPCPATAGEFALDPFKGTCTQLLQYSKEYRKQHMTEDEIKATGGDLEKGLMGYTAPGWRYRYDYATAPPRRIGNEVCLKPTKLENVKFWAEPQMRRIEWNHGWPEQSQCAAEWRRVAQLIEAHERTHHADAKEIARGMETEFSSQVQKEFSKHSKNFPEACGSTKDEAESKMKSVLENQLVKPLVDAAIKHAQVSLNEASRKFHASDKMEIDCSKCKSYSFDRLNIQWKVPWTTKSGPKVTRVNDMFIESSGKICGSPLETDIGYVDLKMPGEGSRVPWGRFRKLHFDPIGAKTIPFGFPRFIATDPPQFEWIVPPPLNYLPPNFVEQIEVSGENIPPTPTARVPAIISEEPLGCE